MVIKKLDDQNISKLTNTLIGIVILAVIAGAWYFYQDSKKVRALDECLELARRTAKPIRFGSINTGSSYDTDLIKMESDICFKRYK